MEHRTRDILVHARELIAKEEHWIQGNLGIKSGYEWPLARAQLKDATCFCAVGALIRATQIVQQNDTIIEAPEDVLASLNTTYASLNFSASLITFNDSHSHTEVLALFDDTINKG